MHTTRCIGVWGKHTGVNIHSQNAVIIRIINKEGVVPRVAWIIIGENPTILDFDAM